MSQHRHKGRIATFVLALAIANTSRAEEGILQEVWRNARGSSIANLTRNPAYRRPADEGRVIQRLDLDAMGDNYGVRYSALLVPPTTGTHTFWIASDDAGELWLSTDAAPDSLEKIAFVKPYSGRRAWKSSGNQKSKEIVLDAGRSYFLRVLHKEGGGRDHLAVAWRGPKFERMILGGPHVRVPTLDAKTAALVERTRAVKEKSVALMRALAAALPQDLEAFIEARSEADRKLLATETGILQRAFEAQDAPPSQREQIEACVRLASALLPSEDEPVTDPICQALLRLEETYLKKCSLQELQAIGAHRAADALGKIQADARPVNRTIALSSRADRSGGELLCTGLYALPGRPVAITTPASLVGKKLVLQIGHHLRAKDKAGVELVCMPDTTRRVELAQSVTRAINPHGGLLFIDVPQDTGLGNERFTISGAVDAPRFVLGKTTDRAWKTIRNNPGPWGELVSAHIAFVAPAEALRDLDNPTELMTWWNENVKAHEGFYNHKPGKPFRMHACYYPVMGVSTWPLFETKDGMAALLNLKQMQHYQNGLFLHEHGHHADDGRMMFGKIGESTPNWAGYYMKATRGDFVWKDTEATHLMKLLDPGDQQHREITRDKWWTEKFTHHWSYPTTSLMVGYAHTFGWETFRACVHRFTDPEDKINKLPIYSEGPVFSKGWSSWTAADREFLEQVKIDKWLIFLSEEAKRDVRPYFHRFYLRPSAEAAAMLDKMKLPEWDLLYCPERPVIVAMDRSVSLTLPSEYARTYSGELAFEWAGGPRHGKLRRDAAGGYTYVPARGFVGRESIPFTLTDKYGNVLRESFEIRAVADERNPHLAAGETPAVRPGTWWTITFPRAYRDPVVLAGAGRSEAPEEDTKGPLPYVTRVRRLSPLGCEVSLHPVDDTATGAARSVTWCVAEAGRYSSHESGILARVGTAQVSPETLGYDMMGMVQSFEGNIPMLRAARFGQVLTSNNPSFTEFYWESVRDRLGFRLGCQVTASPPPEKPETIGFMLLKQGLYQFGDTSVEVLWGTIKVGNVTVQPRSADLAHNRWKRWVAMGRPKRARKKKR